MNKYYKELYNLIIRQKPEKSDAIIWLQGDRYDRGKMVLKLFKKKLSSIIVLTGNNVLIGGGKRLDEKNVSVNDMREWLIGKNIKKNQIIIDNKSLNTKNQAEYVIDLAIKMRWNSIILAGSSYYQIRAFLTFLKQAKDKKWYGKILNQPQMINLNIKPSGRSKMAAEYNKEDWIKINRYKKDLSAIKEGLEHIKQKVVIRNINNCDSKRVWEIRNHKNNRIFMANAREIDYAVHEKWFGKYLKNYRKNFFVLEINSKILGYIRYDDCGKRSEISIAIDSNSQSRGLGSMLLRGSLKKLPENIFRKPIIAKVKKNNEASQRLFKKNNFKIYKEDKENYYLKLIIKK